MNESGEEELFVELSGEKILYSPQFRLYMISRFSSPEHNLQTRCCIVNYNFTKFSLNEYFLDTIFEREKPAKRQEYLLICGREIEALSSSRRGASINGNNNFNIYFIQCVSPREVDFLLSEKMADLLMATEGGRIFLETIF